jgi:hypothetical protein
LFPPFVHWAPQFHFPLSGDVAQRIDPQVVMNAITSAAGDREVEKQVLTEVASYGRQLGLITELLLDLAAQVAPVTPAGIEAQDRLADIARRIDALKP